jgi:DNA modification methylase
MSATTAIDQAAEWFPAKKLKANPRNPRSNDHAVAQVVESIERFGFGSPIVARKKNKMVIAGHTRLKAALQIKLETVPVRFLDIDQALADALMVADNKTSESADWQEDQLAELLAELQEQEVEVPGFEEGEIDRLIESLQEPEEVEPEPVEPLDPDQAEILVGDVVEQLKTLPAASVHCVVTSPPYWGLRDYGTEGQGGLEETPEEHVEWIVGVFREIRRVLRPDGTAWVNYGDCYANGCQSLKPKDLVGMPWRVAFALQADGWYLRSDIIWSKPNPMPESVTDRPTKAHEYIFLLAHPESGGRYFFDADAVKEESANHWNPKKCFGTPRKKQETMTERQLSMQRTQFASDTHHDDFEKTGRNLRDVWHIATQPYPEAHFATYPEKLIEPCVKAGCDRGGVVLDPFNGSGTTGVVALRNGCRYIGIELNPEYAELAHRRISDSLENPKT